MSDLPAHEVADVMRALQRLSASSHKRANWARKKLDRVYGGQRLTEEDALKARIAVVEAFPVIRVADDDPDPEYAAHRAKSAVPIAELLGIVDPIDRTPEPPRRRLPIP